MSGPEKKPRFITDRSMRPPPPPEEREKLDPKKATDLPGDTSDFRLAGEVHVDSDHHGAIQEEIIQDPDNPDEVIAIKPLIAALPPEPERFQCSRCDRKWTLDYRREIRGRELCGSCADIIQKELDEAELAARQSRQVKRGFLGVLLFLTTLGAGYYFGGQSAQAARIWASILGGCGFLAGVVCIIIGLVKLARAAFGEGVGWGILVLANPAVNIGALLLIASTRAFKRPESILEILTPDVLLRVLGSLCPVLLMVFVIWKWASAKRGFLIYMVGIGCFAMAFFGGPRGRQLSLGQWIAEDGRISIQLNPNETITSLTEKATGTIQFTADCVLLIKDFPVFVGGNYNRDKDTLELQYWVEVDDGRKKSKALLPMRFARPTPELRAKAAAWQGSMKERIFKTAK